MVDVSIIFVNYKTKDLTINAIKSVIEKTEGIEYEIFVVDNNSQDGSIEAIEQEFPNIKIIKNSINAGFGSANNMAIKQARGKYILCLNTDTLLINNAVKIMFDFMERPENKNVGACGAYLINLEGKACTCCGKFPNLTEIILKLGLKNLCHKFFINFCTGIKSDELQKVKEIDYISGADIFFQKKVLEKIGLFDEKFFMFFEETELCKRMKLANFDIKIVDSAKIIHIDGGSTKPGLNKKKMFRASELYYFKKHHPRQVWIAKMIYVILYLIDWLILGHKDSKELIRVVLNG